jgi:hypothetical protein
MTDARWQRQAAVGKLDWNWTRRLAASAWRTVVDWKPADVHVDSDSGGESPYLAQLRVIEQVPPITGVHRVDAIRFGCATRTPLATIRQVRVDGVGGRAGCSSAPSDLRRSGDNFVTVVSLLLHARLASISAWMSMIATYGLGGAVRGLTGGERTSESKGDGLRSCVTEMESDETSHESATRMADEADRSCPL